MSKRGLEKNSELFFSTNRNTHENPDVQHHSAISITNNTIEIRMFSGTSSALKLMRSIGLLESIRQYTAQYGFAHATKDSYLEWLSHRHEKIFKIVYAKLSLKCFSQRTYDSVQQFIAQNLEEKKANDDVNKTLLNLPEVVLDDTKNNAITRLLNPFPLEMINFPSAMFMFARRIFGSSIGIQRKVKLDRTSNSFLFACMEQLSFESTEKYTTKLMEMAYTYLTNEAQKAIATKYLALNQNDRTLVSEFARMVLKTMALGATGVNSRSTVEQVYEKLKKLPNVPFSGTEETIELEKLGVSVALEFGFIEIKDDPNPKEAIALIIGALYSGPIDTWEEITTTCKKLENVYSLRRNIITNLIQKYANRFPDIEKKLQPICMVTEQIVLYLNEILTTKTPIVKFKFHASTLLTHACWCTYGYEMFTVRYERKSEIDLLREFSPEIFGGRARESMWTIPSMKVKTKKKIPKKYTILGWPTTITDKYLSLCATSTPDNALRRMFLPPDGQFRERPDPEGREDRDDDYGRQQGVVTHFDDLEQVDSGEALDRIFEIRNGTAPGVAI
jgi:hypothetical protein